MCVHASSETIKYLTVELRKPLALRYWEQLRLLSDLVNLPGVALVSSPRSGEEHEITQLKIVPKAGCRQRELYFAVRQLAGRHHWLASKRQVCLQLSDAMKSRQSALREQHFEQIREDRHRAGQLRVSGF
jgi:hypothetical protein